MICTTKPFTDQRPGTSGLRKKTKVFMQPGYLENFVQSVFNAITDTDLSQELLIVGGDGRYYNRTAIQIIVRMAAANGFGRVMIGQGGILSTPAMSAVIRRQGALGGLVLSASHNPGGPDGDFGIKFNIRNGGPATETVTEQIYTATREISSYKILDTPDINLDVLATHQLLNTEVTIIDPIADYLTVMESIFDFDALRGLFQRGFRLAFDAMHAVTGPYAQRIFEQILGATPGSVINAIPQEDFGGGHPDPNLVYAADLVAAMQQADAPDLGAASDGDGDRNLILGRNFFVTPGDSLAVIVEQAATLIPGYQAGLSGVARSMPTSMAVDRVAAKLNLPCYETPTGWKFFGNLMDAGRCTICGEESFGTGSNHVREKDGIWAVLCWLSILAAKKSSVAAIVQQHWQEFGRSYYQRHDYEGLAATTANLMFTQLREKLAQLPGTSLANSSVAQADDFSYTDPVDHSISPRQGVRVILANGDRLIFRLSGTGTEGATIRIYLETVRYDNGESDIDTVLAPLATAARELLELEKYTQRTTPDVIT